MKKIFSTFLIALLSVMTFANSYWFIGGPYGWGDPQAMTVSDAGYYEYIQLAKQSGNMYFKIQLAKGSWDGALGRFNTTPGYAGTDLTNMASPTSAWDGDNAAIYYVDGPFYVIVYKPNTDLNDSGDPIICASTTLPSEVVVPPTYTVAGSSTALFGTAWAPTLAANDMELVAGLYTWSKEEVELTSGTVTFKVCKNHSWDTAWPASNYELNIAESGKYNVTITFDESTKAITAVAELQEAEDILPTVAFASKEYNKWNVEADVLTPAENKLSASTTLHIDSVGDYEFKMVVGDQWLSLNGDGESFYTFHRGHTNTGGVDGVDLRNMILRADKVGDYEVTWTYATNALEFTFPALANSVVVISNPTNGTITVKNGETNVINGTKIEEFTELTITAVANDANHRITNLRAFLTNNTDSAIAITDGKLTMPGAPLTITADAPQRTAAARGDWDTWAKDLNFTPSKDGKTAEATLECETTGNFAFKVIIDGDYRSNGYWFGRTSAHGAKDITTNSEENMVLVVDKAGDYKLTWTFANDSLGVEFPDLISSAVTITALEYGTITVTNNEASVKSGDKIAELTELSVAASSNNVYDFEVSNLRAYLTNSPETAVVITDGKLTMPDAPITITADERVNTYKMVGSIALFGEEWDMVSKNNEMTRQSNGTYKLEKTEIELTGGETYEYRIARNGAYIDAGNSELNVIRSGEYTLTFTYNPSTSALTLDTVVTKAKEVVAKVYIGGDFNKWSIDADELEIALDEKTASKAIALEEGIHLFKVVKGEWQGKKITVKRGENTNIDFTASTEDNVTLWADVAGDYTFTWTYETNTLEITYPAAPTPASAWLYLGKNVGGEGEKWETLVMTKAGDGKTASVDVDLEGDKNYEFKFIIGNNYRGLDGAESTKYVFHRGNKTAYGAIGDSEHNMLIEADWAGEYTFTWTYENNGISIEFPEEPAITYYIAGNFTNWATDKEPMILADGVWSASIALEADTKYQFQVVKEQGSKETWFGAQFEENEMKYGNSSNWELYAEGWNIKLTSTKKANYTFYFQPSGNKVSVTIPKAPSAIDNTNAEATAVKVLRDGQLLIIKGDKTYNVVGQIR